MPTFSPNEWYINNQCNQWFDMFTNVVLRLFNDKLRPISFNHMNQNQWIRNSGAIINDTGILKRYFFKLMINSLRWKCPNTELFLIRIFLYSDWIRRFTSIYSAVSTITGKYGPEITPYLDTFHAVITLSCGLGFNLKVSNYPMI